MSKKKPTLELSKKQAISIIESEAPINIWHGAVRSGKTVGSILRWIKYVATAPEGQLVMCGRTERALKRNVLDVIQTYLGNEFSYNRTLAEAKFGGRTIHIVGANDERAEEKIRGITCAGAYCDEATLYPKSFFQMLVTRLSVIGAKLFATTNPDSPFHYLKTDYIDKAEELGYKVFHYEIDDNVFLSNFYIMNMKRQFTGLWYKRFIEGRWVMADGVVYDMWNQDHMINDRQVFPKYRYKSIGIDYGISNPTAFVMVGWNTPEEIHVLKEYYYNSNIDGKKQKTDEEFCGDLIKFIGDEKINYIYVDPSALSFIGVLKRYGFKLGRTHNQVLEGIQFVSRLMYEKRVKFHKKCKELVKEIGSYIW